MGTLPSIKIEGLQMIPDQKTAESELDKFRSDLYAIAKAAIANYSSLPPDARIAFTPRTKASIVHDNFFSGLAKFCEGRTDARLHVSKSMRTIILVEKYLLRFKLVGADRLPKNQKTGQVMEFRRQGTLEGLDALVNLEIGYQLSMGKIDLFLICPSSFSSNAWVSKIEQESYESVVVPLFANEPTTPIEPTAPIVQGKKDVKIPQSGDADAGA